MKIAENRGYGPARYFVPRRSPRSQVPSSRRARSGPVRALRSRGDDAAGIYPAVWETDDHDWLIEAFRTLRDFYTVASEAEQAVVTLIAGRCYPDRMTLPSCRVVLCVPDARSIIAGHRISESHERIWRRSTPSQTTYSTPRVS